MRKFWLPFAVVIMTAFLGFADSVTLKTGETVEGTITGETEKDVTISVRVSGGVTDERTISKNDISSMSKTPPDEIAYQAVKDLRPAENAFTLSAFDGEIGALQGFVDTYPGSSHVAEVKKNLAEFEDERAHLEGGQYKVFGKWLSKDDAMKQRYQIASQELFESMEAQVKGRDLIGALNTFTELEKSYPGARVYPDAVDRAKQIVAALHPDIDRRLEVWQHDEEERLTNLELVAEPEKSQLIAAAKAEAKRYDTLCQNAQKSGLKWIPLLPRSEKSLTALQTTVENEEPRLDAIPVEQMHESVQALDRGREAIEEQDALGADSALKEAANLWPANHGLTDATLLLNRLKAEEKATPPPVQLLRPVATPAQVARPMPMSNAPSPGAIAAPSPGSAKAASPVGTPLPVIPAPPPPPAESGVMSFLMSPSGMLVVVGVGVLGAGGALLAARAKKQKEASAE